MKKILINGSPRGDKSNSLVMLNWLNEGCAKPLPIYNLHLEKYHAQAKQAFLEAEDIFIIMPVYCNSLPAQVMKFFESLEDCKHQLAEKQISALIHLGFPEGEHANALKGILERIFAELGLHCKGIIIRGGSEPTRLMPKQWQGKTVTAMHALGDAFVGEKTFPEKTITYLGHPMVLSKKTQFVMKLMDRLGIGNLYWNQELRKNGVLKKSFDTPYA